MYADKAGIFFVNTKKAANWTVEEMPAGRPLDKTQFALIAEERLGIPLISAHTPQAKGRIERLWGALQGRLPIWRCLQGIAAMGEANRRMDDFIADCNRRFAVEAHSTESAFVPLDASNDPDILLAVRHERTTDSCGCFSLQNFMFHINSEKPLAQKKIQFLFSQKIGFLALYDKKHYPVSCLGLGSNRKTTHIPGVVKILIQKNYSADGKELAA